MDQETKYGAAKKYMAPKAFLRDVFFLAAQAALYLQMSLTHLSIQSNQRDNARASGQIISLTSLHKQFEGYMRSDNLQLLYKYDGHHGQDGQDGHHDRYGYHGRHGHHGRLGRQGCHGHHGRYGQWSLRS